MIRMMMWSPKTGDDAFKETMQDFVKTYSGKSATTENFKAIVEKHMTPDMLGIADDRPSMDWFFNEYVYGTALPAYKFDYTFDSSPDGKVLFSFKLVQSGVDESFRMPVPLYIELNDGRVVPIARIRMAGNMTEQEDKVALPLKEKPKRALINYFNDVLASPN
jgi:aminopeptidase N